MSFLTKDTKSEPLASHLKMIDHDIHFKLRDAELYC